MGLITGVKVRILTCVDADRLATGKARRGERRRDCVEEVVSTRLLRGGCFEEVASKRLLRGVRFEEAASKRLSGGGYFEEIASKRLHREGCFEDATRGDCFEEAAL